MPLARRIATLLVDRRGVTLVVVGIITIALLLTMHAPQFVQEDVTDLDPSDPELIYLQKFNRTFGDDEVIAVAVKTDDVFRAPVLEWMKRLSDAIERTPHVERVLSLFTVDDMRLEGEELKSEPFLAEVPDDPSALARKREQALANPNWTGFLVSGDGTLAMLTAVLEKADGAVPWRAEVSSALQDLAKAPPPGVEVLFAGRGPIMVEFESFLKGDMRRYLWLTPLTMCLLLLYAFRNWRGLLITLFTSILAVAWTLALYFETGNSMGMVFVMMPTLLAVISMSDAIHTIAHYQERAAAGGTPREVLIDTMEHMLFSCFLTAFTTVIGFGSLVLSQLQSMQQFGLWMAIGIALDYMLSMALLPALLALLPLPSDRSLEHYEGGLAARLVRSLYELVTNHPRAVRAGWWVAGAVAVAGMFRLGIDSDFISYLPRDSMAARATAVMQQKLAGTSAIEVVLEGAPYSFEEPWALAQVDKMQRFLDERMGVNKTFSIADFLKRMHAVRRPSGGSSATGSAAGELPTDAGAIAEYLFLLAGSKEIDRFLSADRSQARISARLVSMGTAGPIQLIREIEDFGRTLDPRLAVHTTGASKLFAATSHALVAGQLSSLLSSIVLLTLTMMVAARSLRLGLISMLPNVVPVGLTLGLMGWCGFPLDNTTIMISAVALGIAVDDTIHLLARYRREVNHPGVDALRETIEGSGQPCVFSTVVIGSGFALLALSSFGPIRSFGLLTAFTMVIAMVTELLMLPMLLRRFAPPEKLRRA